MEKDNVLSAFSGIVSDIASIKSINNDSNKLNTDAVENILNSVDIENLNRDELEDLTKKILSSQVNTNTIMSKINENQQELQRHYKENLPDGELLKSQLSSLNDIINKSIQRTNEVSSSSKSNAVDLDIYGGLVDDTKNEDDNTSDIDKPVTEKPKKATKGPVPPEVIVPINRKMLKNLDIKVKEKIYGQDSVVDEIYDILKGSVLGFTVNDKKPLGCFFFAGPTGCGKTEIVNQMGDILGVKIQRFDMSEYSTEVDVKKLIGAAPGYAGYDDGGQLTNFIIENPVSIILFDEIEKADASISKILLQLMDNGELTDNKGNKAIFKNAIFIATSNLGAEVEYNTDYTKEEKDTYRMERIKEVIPPEIINRYDMISHFFPISKDTYAKIATKFLKSVTEKILEKEGITFEFTDKVIDFVVNESYDPAMGGRPARRFIEKVLMKGLIDKIYNDELGEDRKDITVDINENNQIVFEDSSDKHVISIVENTSQLIERVNKMRFTDKKKEVTVEEDADGVPILTPPKMKM